MMQCVKGHNRKGPPLQGFDVVCERNYCLFSGFKFARSAEKRDHTVPVRTVANYDAEKNLTWRGTIPSVAKATLNLSTYGGT
jgi:hypothetical protein